MGGGIQLWRSASAGQPGNPTADGTGWETQGLKVNGSIPSDSSANPVVTGTANTAFWTAVGGFGDVGETGDNVTGFGLCATGGQITPSGGTNTVGAVPNSGPPPAAPESAPPPPARRAPC